MDVGIPCAARVQFKAYPSTNSLSKLLFPCDFKILIALTGYRTSPLLLSVLTLVIAVTAISAKRSDSGPMIFEDIEVFAALIKSSLVIEVVGIVSSFLMYLTLSLKASLYPRMIFVGCNPWLTSSFARFKSSDAMITTEVVPSPTSLSCKSASSQRTFPAGCSTSKSFKIVAPSLVIVTSPTWSTSILSNPTGPREDFTILAMASAAVTFCVRTSFPEIRVPSIVNIPPLPTSIVYVSVG
mmetsp:Transcript_12966/g.15736  ORF Transcript_12966/g.15736 Transcript_12966/m.15736 type:complete len:240 (+) Transcript_12966:1749-2468(+)